MKKLLSFILILTLAISCVSMVTFTVNAATCDDLTYTVSNGKVTIIDCDTSVSGALEIPATIDGYPVTSIGSSAFEGCNSLTSVTIPDGVTRIGSYAFSGCSSLTSITIPDSVTSIGNYAFRNCSSLTSVTIGNSVTSIGNDAFSGCSNLTSITIPDSVTSIGGAAFFGCSNLTSITIPDSVTSIGDDAFKNCRSLTSVTIPDSVTSIGNHAFRNCSSLTSIMIPDSVTSIGNAAFSVCSNLTSIMIPDSVTSISDSAFRNCSNLTSITIPDSVTSIGGSAFSGCSNLTSITIPDSVTSIGGSAFKNCRSLTSIIIPDSVTSIGTYAFQNCSSLTSITIGNSVTSIGEDAFYGCSSLETVYYPAAKAKWNNITIGGSNAALTSAELICIDPQITGSSVDVGSTLTVNYFVEFDYLDKFNLTADDFTMRFTSPNGKVELVKGTYDPQSGYYKYPYAGVNPQCMNDNIKAELIYNEEVCAIKEYYSVKEYCERQISRTAEQLGLTETQYNALKTLLANMLVYGSEAQKYKDYNVSELPDVDEWVSEYKSTFTAPTGVKKVTGNADAENKVKSVGLNMANVNRIYFKLILTDENVVIKLNDKVIDRAELIKNADGTFTLYSSDIKATGFNDVHTLTLTQGEEVISTVEYNVNAYVKSKNADATIGNIVKALSNYGASAKRYANSFKTIGDSSFELEDDIL